VFLALGLRGRSRRERQPRPPLLSRQSARGQERLSWRVRLPRSPLPSPQQAQAPSAQCCRSLGSLSSMAALPWRSRSATSCECVVVSGGGS
jgi:hypothetical protein